jgi:catechol 2,3-dioxygenase-like lactoylglutathione lyase family enzyme
MTESIDQKNAKSAFVGSALSVSLTVSDLKRSLTWYRDVIGFSVRRTFEREGKLMAVSLVAGEFGILLSQDDGARGSDRTKGAGFSIRITTEQNIDDLAHRIKN